jgi:hypothetical protein
MLYLEEQCLRAMNINGGLSDAKALLAIPDGSRGAPSRLMYQMLDCKRDYLPPEVGGEVRLSTNSA